MHIPEEYKKPPLGLGDWIINVLIAKIPLIGLIVLIVWAADKSTEKNKANWAKAELIIRLIWVGIALLFGLVIGLGVLSNLPEFENLMD